MPITSQEMLEALDVLEGIGESDLTGDNDGPFHAAAGAGRIVAIGQTEEATNEDELTVTIRSAEDSGGTNAADVASVTVAADGAEAIEAEVEARVTDLADGHTHVSVRVSADAALAGAGMLILGDRRYRP